MTEINCIYYGLFAGIYKNDGPFDVMIDISQIKELHTIPSTNEVCKPLQDFGVDFWSSLKWYYDENNMFPI